MYSESTMFVAAVLGALAIVFLTGKGASIIPGHRSKTPEEQAEVNEKKLCRCAGLVLLVAMVFTLAGDIFFAQGLGLLGMLSSVAWVAFMGAFVVWSNSKSGKRFFAKKEG